MRLIGPADVPAVGDWLDVHLAGDYFFRRRHLLNLVRSANTDAWAVEADGQLIGFVSVYHGSRLHNLYLAADWRGRGLGGALVRLFNPATIRAKTNMLAADPVPFYQKLGYQVVGQDAKRPHILEMARGQESQPMDVRLNAPGSPIATPGGTVAPPPAIAGVVPGGQATSPSMTPAKLKAPPSIGAMTGEQITAIASRLRAMSDAELAAVGQAAAVNSHWRKRQAEARAIRVEKERQAAAAAAGQHLQPGLTGEALAKAAAAQAQRTVDALFAPPPPSSAPPAAAAG